MHIDPHVYTTRPGGMRLPQETAVYDLLDRLQVPYWRVDHEAAATVDSCRDVERILGIAICKNLFLCNRQKTAFYLLMMPGDKPFHTRDLSAQIGSSRLSFADPAHMWTFLHVTPGSVSILGLMHDADNCVRLLMDREVVESVYLGCHPCINTTSLRLATADVLGKFLPAVGHTYTVVDLPALAGQ